MHRLKYIELLELLYLVDNFACSGETFDHLLTFFPSANSVFRLFEEIFKLTGFVHVLQELLLHFFFRVSIKVSKG
jgi:hypothetical protein